MRRADAGGGASQLQRWLPLGPALLLCGVAHHQVYLSRAHGLSPWTGGGFGMFSTTDVGPQRRLRLYLVGEDGARELGVPVPLEDRAERAAGNHPAIGQKASPFSGDPARAVLQVDEAAGITQPSR